MASTHILEQDNPSEVGDPNDSNRWTLLAEKYWLKPSKSRNVNAQVVKLEIWDVLQKNGFQYRSLLFLESLQLLEKSVSAQVLDSKGAESV